MSLSLNTIKPAKGSTKKAKRIGRGNASGTGTYSGKGLKGQKSRSGVSGLKRLGMRQVLLRTPKLRGFTSLKPKAQVVSFAAINHSFRENEVVNTAILFEKGLIKTLKHRVKVLANGELTTKGLEFNGVEFSKTAKELAEKSGAKIK